MSKRATRTLNKLDMQLKHVAELEETFGTQALSGLRYTLEWERNRVADKIGRMRK